MIEVYWPTGDLSWRQPQAEPVDLSQPDEVLLEPDEVLLEGDNGRTVTSDGSRHLCSDNGNKTLVLYR
jgi:hypothetical protein